MYRRERFPATRPAILAFFLRLKSHSALGCGRSKNVEVLDQVQDHAKGLGHRQQRLQLRRQVGGQGRGHVPEVKSKQQGSKQFCKFTVIYYLCRVRLQFVVRRVLVTCWSHFVHVWYNEGIFTRFRQYRKYKVYTDEKVYVFDHCTLGSASGYCPN